MRRLFPKAKGHTLAKHSPDAWWQYAPHAAAEPWVEASKPRCSADEYEWAEVAQQTGLSVSEAVQKRLVPQLLRDSVDGSHRRMAGPVVVRDAVARAARLEVARGVHPVAQCRQPLCM